MSNRSWKSAKFSIYDKYTTGGLILGLTSMCILAVALSVFFVFRFLIASFDPTVILLLLIVDCPWIYAMTGLIKQGLISRLFFRICFNEEGIHIRYFARPHSIIKWDEIHTYGVIGYSVSYMSKTIIFFSNNRKEFAPKNAKEANVVSSNRIIIQYRNDVWVTLSKYMPSDMKRKLFDSLNKEQDCFFKR